MHKERVQDRGWLTAQPFQNAMGFCMLLPGPEAMHLATYACWRLHDTLSGLIARLFGLSCALAFRLRGDRADPSGGRGAGVGFAPDGAARGVTGPHFALWLHDFQQYRHIALKIPNSGTIAATIPCDPARQ